MIRHVVMFKFRDEIDSDTRTDFINRVNRMAVEVEVIRALELGQNFADSPRAYDLVLIVDLDNEEALEIYASHPKHLPVKEMAAQLCSAFPVVDYELIQG
jgi:hypothetical protein